MSNKSVSYSIDLEIPESYAGNLLDFIYRKYLLQQPQRFVDISRAGADGNSSLVFSVLDQSGKRSLQVEIVASKPIEVNIKAVSETAREEAMTQIRQDVLISVELFEEKVRKSTLFFAWREGERIVPEQVSGKEKKSINRLFLETQVLLFIIFITIGFFLFPIMGMYAPIALMAIQLVIVFYSYKFIERTADWRITEDNPTIHLLEYSLPLEEQEVFTKKYPKEKILEIKKEMYEQTISKKGEIDCETAGQVFKKHGLECSPENLSARKVNVYELVKKILRSSVFPCRRSSYLTL